MPLSAAWVIYVSLYFQQACVTGYDTPSTTTVFVLPGSIHSVFLSVPSLLLNGQDSFQTTSGTHFLSVTCMVRVAVIQASEPPCIQDSVLRAYSWQRDCLPLRQFLLSIAPCGEYCPAVSAAPAAPGSVHPLSRPFTELTFNPHHEKS